MEKDFGFMTTQDWRDVVVRFRLTPREVQLLQQILAGRTAEELERVMELSNAALQKHLLQLYRKVGAQDRIDLALRVTRGTTRQKRGEQPRYDAEEDDLSA